MPQCDASVIVSTQTLIIPMPLGSITSHAVWPEGHAGRHMPETHISSMSHAASHAPQLALSVCVSVHAAPHRS